MKWMNLYNQMRNLVVSNRNVIRNSMKEVTFGKERVNKGTQVYKSLILLHLLLVTMFDLNPYEIVYHSGREVVLHFCSSGRVSKLYNFVGVNLSRY